MLHETKDILDWIEIRTVGRQVSDSSESALLKKLFELVIVVASIIVNQQGSEPPSLRHPMDAWKQGIVQNLLQLSRSPIAAQVAQIRLGVIRNGNHNAYTYFLLASGKFAACDAVKRVCIVPDFAAARIKAEVRLIKGPNAFPIIATIIIRLS
jgi:hypothetical protein